MLPLETPSEKRFFASVESFQANLPDQVARPPLVASSSPAWWPWALETIPSLAVVRGRCSQVAKVRTSQRYGSASIAIATRAIAARHPFR